MGHLLRSVAAGLFLAVFSVGQQAAVRAAGKPLLVVVSAATPLKDISIAQLRRAFQGEGAEYAPGKRLIPINHPVTSPGRLQFDRVVLGLTAEEIGRFWVDRRIRDQSGPPKAVPTAELALRVVTSLPGAITYIAAEELNSGVRALTIDGKSADAPGYALAQ